MHLGKKNFSKWWGRAKSTPLCAALSGFTELGKSRATNFAVPGMNFPHTYYWFNNITHSSSDNMFISM